MKNLGFSNPGTILLPLGLRDDASNHTYVLKDLMPSWAFMEPELALTLGYVGWDL